MNKIVHSAIVKKFEKGKVWATISTQSACAQCQLKGACNLAECKDKTIEIATSEAANYAVGQKIEVAIGSRQAAFSLLLAYIFPLVLLLATFFVTQICGVDEIIGGFFSIIVLLPYYLLLKFADKHLKKMLGFAIEKRKSK